MKLPALPLVILLICMSEIPSFAQSSPEVLDDGRVTFRFRAPDANEVKASGQFGDDLTLTKGEKGLWEGTTVEKVPAGVFEYRFKVDGLNIIDGRNPAIKPQRWPGASILHIPSDPPAAWDLQDIPHGTLHHHTYRSKSLGKWRDLVVYTPARAGTGSEPLPVLFLSHGFSDNHATWAAHGKAHWILDALIHTGKAKPMILVMPDAHPIPPKGEEFEVYGPKNTDAFCKEVLNDVIPFVEANYNVKKDASSRAFAGLSMRGRHALTFALRHSDQFSQIGAFSSAPPSQSDIEAAGKVANALNDRLKVFWVACGDKDFLFEKNQEMHAAFEKSGIRHEYVITKGDDHSWPVWRRYLETFAPMVFQD